MVVTLDYAGFPHLFDQIMKCCDPPTQNRLRLLSSATKLQVDLHQCRYIHVHALGEGLAPHVRALRGAEILNYRITPVPTPLLPLRHVGGITISEKPSVEFVLRNARHIVVGVNILFFISSDHRLGRLQVILEMLDHVAEKCTTLTLFGLPWLCEMKPTTSAIVIPSAVRHLRILPEKRESLATEGFGHYIDHSCSKVTVIVGDYSDSIELSSVIDVVKPCVENLNVIVNNGGEVSSILLSLEPARLHPELQVTVYVIDTVEPSVLSSFESEWSKIVHTKVTALQYVVESEGLSSDWNAPDD